MEISWPDTNWLTRIAKSINPKIEHVRFEPLEPGTYGTAGRRHDCDESYYIRIAKDQLICPLQVFYVFYHELGHLDNYHLGYRYYGGNKEDKEFEADWYAFKRLGMIGDLGIVKDEWETCHGCMKQRSKVCLKGGSLWSEEDSRTVFTCQHGGLGQ